MPKLEGPSFSADIDWHPSAKPVIYIVGHGSAHSPAEALSVIDAAVKIINEGPFEHVCTVYNMLDLDHMPMLARFIRSGRISTTSRTAHIIIATHNAAIQLLASVLAVTGSKRLRTMDVCKSQEDIETAVNRWLSLPDHAREYTIDNL